MSSQEQRRSHSLFPTDMNLILIEPKSRIHFPKQCKLLFPFLFQSTPSFIRLQSETPSSNRSKSKTSSNYYRRKIPSYPPSHSIRTPEIKSKSTSGISTHKWILVWAWQSGFKFQNESHLDILPQLATQLSAHTHIGTGGVGRSDRTRHCPKNNRFRGHHHNLQHNQNQMKLGLLSIYKT